jgi:hypothetical protein
LTGSLNRVSPSLHAGAEGFPAGVHRILFADGGSLRLCGVLTTGARSAGKGAGGRADSGTVTGVVVVDITNDGSGSRATSGSSRACTCRAFRRRGSVRNCDRVNARVLLRP